MRLRRWGSLLVAAILFVSLMLTSSCTGQQVQSSIDGEGDAKDVVVPSRWETNEQLPVESDTMPSKIVTPVMAENVDVGSLDNPGMVNDSGREQPGPILEGAKGAEIDGTSVPADEYLDTGLPVVVINTENNRPVLDKDNKIPSQMMIIDGGVMEYGKGLYEGPVTIKGRGNSTWDMPKKSYAISTPEDAAMLDMPAGDDWVLLANYADKSLMRNYIALELGRSMSMAYSPKMRFVELYLNGEYMGNYLLGEKIEIAKDRLNINKLKKTDVSGNAITGGYLIEKDWPERLDSDDNYFYTEIVNDGQLFAIKEPKSSKITLKQIEYITEYFNEAEEALYGEDFDDLVYGYQKYYDVDSLIDWYIVNELYKNVDANFGSSCYLYKDRNGKIHFGPLWDFDLGAGNANYNDADQTEGFYVKDGMWISRFFDDPAFIQKVKERWGEVRAKYIPAMFDLIRKTEKTLGASADSNFEKWRILGVWVWPNANGPENRQTYKSEVDYLVDWLTERVEWLDVTITSM